jgi:hypothetical protein
MTRHSNQHRPPVLAALAGVSRAGALAALTLSLLVTATPATAALVATNSPVANLRIEGGVGFIGFSQPMGDSTQCVGRVWVDMTDPVARSMYATALVAFQTRQPVQLRAYEDSQRQFGACQLHDIVLQAQ